VRDDAKRLAAGFEPELHTGSEAVQIVALTAEIERVYSAVGTLAMRRVERTGMWTKSGAPTPEHWLARVKHTSVREAAAIVDTGTRLGSGSCDATETALRNGDLSAKQAAIVTDAATVDPGAEARLLRAARTESLGGLTDEAKRVKLAKLDETAQQRAHRHRHWRHSLDADGAFRFSGQTTAAAGVDLARIIDAFADPIFQAARDLGEHEPREAYAADALLTIARFAEQTATPGTADTADTATAPPPVTKSKLRAILRVDGEALQRGHLHAGEICEIVGLGPIDLTTARQLLGDAIIDIVVRHGIDVRTLAHAGRDPTLAQWIVAYSQGYECNVDGCGQTHQLQLDHTPPYEQSRITACDQLEWKCTAVCHPNKTYKGWTDGEKLPNGKRKLIPPPNPPPPNP